MTTMSVRDTPAMHPPEISPEVVASLRYCADVARRLARNFYYGMKLTPEPRRSAIYAVYAFMRHCDDLADEDEQAGIHVRRERIETFRAQMQQVIDGGALPAVVSGESSVWPAFRHVIQTYDIDPAHLHAMLDGQIADLEPAAYQTFGELYDYCHKVASGVGLVCISIWGHDGSPPAHQLAEKRGIALQLTNILRDVVEDAQRGRIYLPRDELERFGYDPALLLSREGNDAFDRLMAFQIQRARAYYTDCAALERHLAPDCRATAWTLMAIYRGLLEKIAHDPRRVLHERVRLSRPAKLLIAARGRLKRFA